MTISPISDDEISARPRCCTSASTSAVSLSIAFTGSGRLPLALRMLAASFSRLNSSRRSSRFTTCTAADWTRS